MFYKNIFGFFSFFSFFSFFFAGRRPAFWPGYSVFWVLRRAERS